MWLSSPENLAKIQASRVGGHTAVRYAVDTAQHVGKVACTCGVVVGMAWGVAHTTYLALLQDAWLSHGAA
jgi:L-alanine-DL-glutamate epimerase-like enolase superfamily enzyme